MVLLASTSNASFAAASTSALAVPERFETDCFGVARSMGTRLDGADERTTPLALAVALHCAATPMRRRLLALAEAEHARTHLANVE